MNNEAKLRKGQSGQILMYTTLIVMLAALILVPLMQFAFTGHRSAQVRQERTLELYASDAGIEDALYQIKTEKTGSALGNLSYGNTSSFDTGTPSMNDRTVNVGVQKVWIPQNLPGNLATDAPTTDTDKSSQLVVVGMLQTVQAAAASDDFNSGTWSGGSGNWTGDWNHTGSASLASGGASGYSLNLAGAAGSATRQTSLPKYVASDLKFDAQASSFGPSDTASCQVSPDGSNWTTVETWSHGNETPDYNSFNINLSDQYGLGGGNTTVPLWVRFDANLSSSVIASDNFESNSWTGGSGWASQWTNSSGSGNPGGGTAITNTGSPYEGSYHLRLSGSRYSTSRGYAQRNLNLSNYAAPHLQFWAKASSFGSSDNAQLLLKVGSGSFTSLLTWVHNGSGNLADDNTYHFFDIDLSQFGASGQSSVWIAFKSNTRGTNSYLYVDDVKIVQGSSFSVDNLWIGYQANANTIEIAYTGADLGGASYSAYLDRVGVWMPPGCHYIGVVGNETTPELFKEPTTILPSTYADGTILEWDYGNVIFQVPPAPMVKTLAFTYEVDVTQGVEGMFTWIKAHGGSDQTYISWDKGYEIYKATSQAHSQIYGTNTDVTAYAAQGEVNKKNAASYGDYVATGSPLLVDYIADPNGVKETAINPSDPSTWVSSGGFLYDGRSEITSIPSDATVTAAWLYWSAFMNNSDWASFGSQPDTTVSFMYPKRYGTETFAVHAGDGDDAYTTAAWAGAQESMDLLAHTPVLTLSPMRYWGESPGIAVNGNGNDTFFTAHKPVLSSPSAKVWVGSNLLTEGTDYVINYATGNVTIINDTLSGQVTIDYSVSGSMTLTNGTDYTINQSTLGSDTRYTGFTVVNDNLEGTVTIDYYYAKHWETVQHAAFDKYGTPLAPAQTQVPLSNPVGHTYACFDDVTQLLTGNGTYINYTGDGQYAVGNVKATPGVNNTDYATRCFSGWSLIVLFQSPTETAHQFYLWDPIHNATECPFMVQPVTDFSPQPQYINVPFTLNGFYPPEGTVDGKVTYFVGEGDSVYSGDSIGFKGASQTSYTYLSGPNNPVDNVMNCISTTGEKGVDIDTYDIWQQVGSDTAANVNLRTQGDRWYLVYMILAFKTNVVPKSDYAFNVASVTYQYDLGAQQ